MTTLTAFPPPYGDPYDLWATPIGLAVRQEYYQGRLLGKLGAVTVGLADWWLPGLSRAWFAPRGYIHPITLAYRALLRAEDGPLAENAARALLAGLDQSATRGYGGVAWGLNMPWMSKNGLYGPEIPFVTHTPYVLEALLALAACKAVRESAMALFHDSWGFLHALRVMEQGPETLALSYGPVEEPRIVVNAQAYAAFCFGLHAEHGLSERREQARAMANALVTWVIRHQAADGSWHYYADDLPGNFIDGFHTCFVLKNLLRTPHDVVGVVEVIERGWGFLRERFIDPESGLCRRFVVKANRDPFVWDLYDQAEYLGLLVDFGLLEEAMLFRERVVAHFRRGDVWWCRIDFLGRRWGRGFLRWGILPFQYQEARLERAIKVSGVQRNY